jgi:hypothetical protein
MLTAAARAVLLELLEPYILNDRIKAISPEVCPSPCLHLRVICPWACLLACAQVVKALVEHYSGLGRLSQVEQCVLHLDISCLDFQQIVQICRQHKLFSGLIYVFN